MLRLLDVKHWRDAASHYDSDPKTQMTSGDDKFRMIALSRGVKNALSADIDDVAKALETAQPEPGWWELGKAKKRESGAEAQKLNKELKPPRTM